MQASGIYRGAAANGSNITWIPANAGKYKAEHINSRDKVTLHEYLLMQALLNHFDKSFFAE